MFNFTFYNPVRIHFGSGQIDQLQNEIAPGKKVLLVYGGGSIKTNGIYKQVIDNLQDREVFEFPGVGSNPSFETLYKAIPIVRDNNIDIILAVGGGSVIDGSKFIAAAAHFDGDPWKMVTKGIEIQSAVPLGTVLTMAATASEMNFGAVISREETKEKLPFFSPHIFPRFSILDPSYTFSVPPYQSACGIVDIFIHVLEQYITYPAEAPLQDRFAEAILRTLIEEAPKIMDNPYDYDARGNIMWCGTLALNDLLASGVPTDWATHMIGHELTALFGLKHAETLAIVWPSVAFCKRWHKKEKLLQYGKRVWGIATGGEEQRIEQIISRTQKFFSDLGLKLKLSDYGIEESQIPMIVDALTKHEQILLGERQDITPREAGIILRHAF